ncbi:TetR/AcrR family transcriptional regulator [Nocardia wallacei]|uniref:TetR/AcrR family transcriptional regulator n=1 Tax=Nocardia wallacei TaxID=480035 RepID=UPI003CC8009A
MRNRALLLEAARALMAERGASNVTMDGLAERSGLGKGTVFRRFGSRAGIFRALLDEEESALQQAVLSGEPPLGPGAPALERLIAYGTARIEFLFEHLDIAGHPRRGPGRPGRERKPAVPPAHQDAPARDPARRRGH